MKYLLSRDLTYFYGGGAATDLNLKSYIDTHITAQNVPGGKSPKSFHLRNDNGSVNMIGSAIAIGTDAFVGFFVDFNTGDAYSFKKAGADTVLKKLGSQGYSLPTVDIWVPQNKESFMYFPINSMKNFSFIERGHEWCNARGDIIYEDGSTENFVPTIGDGVHTYNKTLTKDAKYLKMRFWASTYPGHATIEQFVANP